MSDKTLLNEGTIRRFMKLAELEPLASPFIERIDEDVELALEQEDEGEEEEEELDLEDDEGDLELDGAGDEGLEDDELEGEEAGLDVEDEEEPLDDMALEEEETQIVAEVARRVTKRILSSK